MVKQQLQKVFLTALFLGLVISFVLLAIFSFESFDTIAIESLEKGNKTKRAYLVPTAIAIVGISGSISGYFLARDIGEERVTNEIISLNQTKIKAIENEIASSLKTLAALSSVFELSSSVSREEFKTYAQAFLL